MSRRRQRPRNPNNQRSNRSIRNGRVPGRAIRQANAQLEHAVRRHGWMIQYVGGPNCTIRSCNCTVGKGTGPPFAYTVGLFGFRHPELLVFSVSPQRAASVLNAFGEEIRAGAPFHEGDVVDIDGWGHRVVCEEVPNPGEIALAANRFYRRRRQQSVPVLQLTYDDDNGSYPWEEGYAGDEQPRPGTFRA